MAEGADFGFELVDFFELVGDVFIGGGENVDFVFEFKDLEFAVIDPVFLEGVGSAGELLADVAELEVHGD